MSESAEAKCDPFLQILEPMVRKLLADKDGWEAEDWDEDAFQVFFSEIGLWLKNEKKEKSRVVAKTVAGLISYGATSKEKLQRVGRGDYDKFTAKLSAKGIPEAICDLLFEKYVAKEGTGAVASSSKRAWETGGGGDGKRQCISQIVGQGDTLAEFIRVLPDANMDDSESFLRFAGPLFGVAKKSSIVYIRKCYDILWDESTKYLEAAEGEHRAVVIMGTPGTGKTVCGLYHAWKLVKAGETVVYTYQYEKNKGGKAFLFAPKDSDVLAKSREDGFDLPQPIGSWVGEILAKNETGRSFVEWLSMQRSVNYFIDPPRSGINILPEFASTKWVYSSPHRSKENTLSNVGMRRYMPLWDLELELKPARTKLGLDITNKELEDRYDQFGGIARWILSDNIISAQDVYEEAISDLTFPDGQNLLDPFGPRKDHSSIFVHIVPETNLRSKRHMVSTNMMKNYLALRLIQSKNMDMASWASAARGAGIPSGDIFEQVWLTGLAIGGHGLGDCQLRALGTETIKTVALTAFPIQPFRHLEMKDLLSVKEGDLCVPLSRKFETFDAWFVKKEPFCAPENSNLCLVGLQMTVAGAHPLKQAGMVRVIKKAEDLFNCKFEASEIFIVFVTAFSNSQGFAVQKWISSEGKEPKKLQDARLKSVQQYVLGISDKKVASAQESMRK